MTSTWQMRLGGWLLGGTVAFTALALLARSHANAAATELVQQAGTRLLAYANATQDEGVRTLHLNGAPLEMRTGSTRDDVDTVLDGYETRCRERRQRHRREAADSLADFEGVVRFGNAESGFLGCLDPGAEPVTPRALLARISRFSQAGDLAALGALEVVWAMRVEQGARYLVVRPEGELHLFELFPSRGDAPGIDVPGAPQLPGSRRLLSVWQTGTAPMLASYASKLSPVAFAQEYGGFLKRAGFAVRIGPKDSAHGAVLHAARDPRDPAQISELLVLVGADDAGGSLVTIAPLFEQATR